MVLILAFGWFSLLKLWGLLPASLLCPGSCFSFLRFARSVFFRNFAKKRKICRIKSVFLMFARSVRSLPGTIGVSGLASVHPAIFGGSSNVQNPSIFHGSFRRLLHCFLWWMVSTAKSFPVSNHWRGLFLAVSGLVSSFVLAWQMSVCRLVRKKTHHFLFPFPLRNKKSDCVAITFQWLRLFSILQVQPCFCCGLLPCLQAGFYPISCKSVNLLSRKVALNLFPIRRCKGFPVFRDSSMACLRVCKCSMNFLFLSCSILVWFVPRWLPGRSLLSLRLKMSSRLFALL